MTEASIERIEPDPWLARAFLERSRTFLADGSVDTLAAESSQVLLHGAAVAACDAVLAVNGRRVIGADGGHRLRLTTAERFLPDAPADLFVRLDDVRVTRNEASYAAELVPLPAIDEAVAAVAELVALADAHVAPHLPPYIDEEG